MTFKQLEYLTYAASLVMIAGCDDQSRADQLKEITEFERRAV